MKSEENILTESFIGNLASSTGKGLKTAANTIKDQNTNSHIFRNLKRKTSSTMGGIVQSGKDTASKIGEHLKKNKDIINNAAKNAAKKFEDSGIGKRVVDPVLAGVIAAKRRYAFKQNYNKPIADWYPKHEKWEQKMGEQHPRMKEVIKNPIY